DADVPGPTDGVDEGGAHVLRMVHLLTSVSWYFRPWPSRSPPSCAQIIDHAGQLLRSLQMRQVSLPAQLMHHGPGSEAQNIVERPTVGSLTAVLLSDDEIDPGGFCGKLPGTEGLVD